MNIVSRVAITVLASMGSVTPISAIAGSVDVEAICWTAYASAMKFDEPTPYHYEWNHAGAVSFSSYCPATGGTNAACGLACMWAGNGSVTVSVRDGNGALLGTSTENLVCFFDPNGSLMISSCL